MLEQNYRSINAVTYRMFLEYYTAEGKTTHEIPLTKINENLGYFENALKIYNLMIKKNIVITPSNYATLISSCANYSSENSAITFVC